MKHLSSFHRQQLQVIYEAYDRVYDIASHRWHALQYYVKEFHMSNLFGHYVRSLPEFKGIEPSRITINQYMTASAPLAAAFNEVIGLIMPECGDDIYSIIDGSAGLFGTNTTPYDRSMAIFRLVEKHYPRAEYREPVTPPKLRRPRPPRTPEHIRTPYID